jgi:hypothetical protein
MGMSNDKKNKRVGGLRDAFEELSKHVGCGDSSCVFGTPRGMATNGGCICIERARPFVAAGCGKLYRALRDFLAAEVEGAEVEGAEVEGASTSARVRFGMFPIMRDRITVPTPSPERIPWSVAEIAYTAYAARFGRYQSLERIAERGGFYVSEMNALCSDWREKSKERS